MYYFILAIPQPLREVRPYYEEGFEPRYFLIPKAVLYTIIPFFPSTLFAHKILVKVTNFQVFLFRYSGSVGLA